MKNNYDDPLEVKAEQWVNKAHKPEGKPQTQTFKISFNLSEEEYIYIIEKIFPVLARKNNDGQFVRPTFTKYLRDLITKDIANHQRKTKEK